MHDETANTNSIGRVDHSPRSVLKHGPANALAVVRLRHRKAREDDDGDRIGHIASKTTRRRRDGDSARCQCVVSDYSAGLAANECTRSTGQLICASTTLKPFIEYRLSARKATQVMLGSEWRGGGELHPTFQGNGCFIVRRSLALGFAGASRRSMNSAYALGPTEIRD
jgi:hypothetical protein